ncbi:MAG: family 10 glycosylhydrolase, partial [Cetobacterium sp.]
MKKYLVPLCLMTLTLPLKANLVRPEIPKTYVENKETMRTTWVATVDNLHYPKVVDGIIRNSIEELKADWLEILKVHEDMNFNTVIFQVSPTLDALYKSEHRPWSHVLTGTQGLPPEWSDQ